MNFLGVSSISKEIRGSVVLSDITFGQQKGWKIAIAGETGSGKSTLLKIIAGLVQPGSGEVYFEGIRVKGPDEKLVPGHPGIAYLSQQFELANNYRVEEVLDYANQLSEEDAGEIYKVCRIDHLLQRRTDQVSGGEKQRIAFARLLINSPRLLLLDEPYSNLDMIHRNVLRSVIDDTGKNLDVTCIMISQDPSDTLSWADEIIVLKDGKILQQGSPVQVYSQPVNEYVAALFGRYNRVSSDAATLFKELADLMKGSNYFFIRPEDVSISMEPGMSPGGVVKKISYLGSCYELEIELSGTIIKAQTALNNIDAGDLVHVSINHEKGWFA